MSFWTHLLAFLVGAGGAGFLSWKYMAAVKAWFAKPSGIW